MEWPIGDLLFASGDGIQSFWSSFFQKARGSRAEPSSPSAEGETPPAFKSPRAWVPAIEAPILNSIREADTSFLQAPCFSHSQCRQPVGRADSRFAKGTITLTVLFYRIHAAAGSAGLQFAKGTDALTVLFFRIQASVRIRGTLEKNEGTNKGGSHARASPYLLFNFNDAGIYWNPFIRFI